MKSATSEINLTFLNQILLSMFVEQEIRKQLKKTLL